MFNTIRRVEQLAAARNMSPWELCLKCDIPTSTFGNARARGGELGLYTCERIADALGITLAEFFTEEG